MTRSVIPTAMRQQYEAYINSAEWKQRRKRAIELAGYRCERCGATAWDKRLEVHHLTYERLGHEADNDLQALCSECHEKADKERSINSRYRAQQTLQERRLDGWATKKYGENWFIYHDEDAVAEEFESWLERRGDA